ncbi:hypothetical protein RBB50_011504 [Rhinocladiella similis]
MAEECSEILKETLPDNPEWHVENPSTMVSKIVSRMSTRAFLGKDFCEDPNWINSTEQYATTLFYAAERLSVWHPWIRPIAQWVLPYCKKLRVKSAECSAIMRRVLTERKEVRETTLKEGRQIEKEYSTIEWAEQAANGQSYEPAKIQLSLGLGAIATSTNTLSWFMLCIAKHPEYLQPLRDEIISVLRDGGDG